MSSMTICRRCGRLASWNSRFGCYYCRVCGDMFMPARFQKDPAYHASLAEEAAEATRLVRNRCGTAGA